MDKPPLDIMLDTLNRFAVSLGIEAARLWPKVVFIHWLRALCWILADALATALAGTWALLTYGWAVWAVGQSRGSYSYEEWVHGYIVLAIISALLFVVALILLLCGLVLNLPRLIDAEGSLVEGKISQ